MIAGKTKNMLWLCCLLLTLMSPLSAKGSKEFAAITYPHPTETTTIAMDLGDDTLVLDPRFATDSNSMLIASSLYEGLFEYDPKTTLPIPALVETWTVSDNGLVWDFTLRPNLKFSDGTPITAKDFIESWFSMFEGSSNRTSLASMLDIVTGMKAWRDGSLHKRKVGLQALSDKQLRITLETPAPYLPMVLSNAAFAVVPPSLRSGKVQAGSVTSGPFILVDQTKDSILLKRNTNYWSQEMPKSEYITIDTTGSSQEVFQRYAAGDIQWSLAFIPFEYLTSNSLFFTPQYSTSFFYFSSPSGPYSDESVRQAMYELIDWEEVRRINSQPLATETLVPGSTTEPIAYAHPQAHAMQLLEEAGYPQGNGLPPLVMAVHRGSQIIQAAEYIADTWSSELGLTVILDTVPLSVYVNHPEMTPYDFACITWIGDYYDPTAFLTMWMSDSTFNIANYNDVNFDELMSEALRTEDLDLRSKLLIEAEQYLLDQRVVIPTSNGFSTNFVQTNLIDGWYENLLNIHPLKYLSRK